MPAARAVYGEGGLPAEGIAREREGDFDRIYLSAGSGDGERPGVVRCAAVELQVVGGVRERRLFRRESDEEGARHGGGGIGEIAGGWADGFSGDAFDWAGDADGDHLQAQGGGWAGGGGGGL